MSAELVREAMAQGREVLLEHEVLGWLAELGRPVPRHRFMPLAELDSPAAAEDFEGLPVVLKVVSEKILHKSDVGGVVFLEPLVAGGLPAAARRMLEGLPDDLRDGVQGVLLAEKLELRAGLGRELLLGMRHSPEFGPVFTVGFGGTAVEALAGATLPDQSTVLLHPEITDAATLAARLERSLFFRWATGGVRGQAAVSLPGALRQELQAWMAAIETIRKAVEAAGRSVAELELNPLAHSSERWLPLDALLRLGPAREQAAPFPLSNLRRALDPGAVALLGVSTRSINMGRVILRCILDGGFDPARVRVVREGVEQIDGVACVASLAHLPEPVDQLILAVAADQVPAVLGEVFGSGKVRSVLLIPGGMGETEGGKGIERQVLDLLAQHAGEDRPALVGNNSLGLISRRSRFDSLFIPHAKLPRPERGISNVALVSQSGAFMITRLSKLDFLAPDYQLSIGNQIDARMSHFVQVLAGTEGISTFALYVEGLKPGDGLPLARAVRQISDSGRDVVVYKAGRSSLGQAAAMGHTASVAGDYRVFASLMADAGALVAETLDEFLDLTRLSATLHEKRLNGRRLALLSNAGYEAVAMADSHRGPGHRLEPARFSPATAARLQEVLEQAGIGKLVEVKNPLDVTPMARDQVHALCMRAILDDPGVDLAVFGNVPLSPNLQSLPPGIVEGDAFDAAEGYARQAIQIFRDSDKPFVVVIDAGRLYDPMFHLMQDAGLPVFRSGDAAVRALGLYTERRLAGASRAAAGG